MSGIRPIITSLVLSIGLVHLSAEPAAPPDLSGQWVLTLAPLAKSMRAGTGKQAEPEPNAKMIDTVGGAAFNCGSGCTIVHKGTQLTIDQARLSTDNGRDVPKVTIVTDGKSATVQDSFNTRLSLTVTAEWRGAVLNISSVQNRTTTQEISLKDGKMVVVSQLPFAGVEPMTFVYEKK